MNRLTQRPLSGALLALTLASGVAFGAAAIPAQAAAGAGFYHAELSAPLAEPRQEILSGVVWKCEGTSCSGTKSGSRPVIVCGRLAQKVGEISSFSHAGNELDAKSIERCNKG